MGLPDPALNLPHVDGGQGQDAFPQAPPANETAEAAAPTAAEDNSETVSLEISEQISVAPEISSPAPAELSSQVCVVYGTGMIFCFTPILGTVLIQVPQAGAMSSSPAGVPAAAPGPPTVQAGVGNGAVQHGSVGLTLVLPAVSTLR